jgi:hypothetical protein
MLNKYRLPLLLIAAISIFIGGYIYGRGSLELNNSVSNIQANPQNSANTHPNKSPDSHYELQVKKVESEGYTPVDFEPSDSFSFRVIVGSATGSAGGYGQRAFFFNNGNYIGIDTTSPSAIVNVAWRDDKVIALEYVLYKGDEPMCCPTGGSQIVRFQLEGEKLVALDSIPTDSWEAELSRR